MFRTKPGEGRALVEEWINRPALRKLVEAFGGTWPTGDLETVVAELVEFSQIWDYRSGESRLMFHDDQEESDPHEELTYQAAEELGMINPPPPAADEYDYLLILGGLATGVEPRVKYAAQLIADGLKIRKQIAGLGSFRPLQERELPISAKYAPAGRYEIDHLGAMIDQLLGMAGEWVVSGEGDPDKEPATASQTWRFIPANSDSLGPELVVYAASSSEPSHRPANTADTYVYLAEQSELEAGQSALVITSAIYLPYQHIDAVHSLSPYGIDVETVGLRRSRTGPTHPPHAYRQEIRSTLRSAQRYLSVRG